MLMKKQMIMIRKKKKALYFRIFVERTKHFGRVVIWQNPNSGSKGDAHGRFDQDLIRKPQKYFKVGDRLVLLKQL